ncbi:maleylpyruvate isomerase family mycothiol-dependent enzyme [Streptomyces sp. NPDC101455]|uniref:maleylpyruvate isomerase family mycothiol-dependent enzyme n=1 Tax=Streptomyces sp. NPDC101455 TaxID=3366142 RepID=UPI0038178B82
MTPAVVRDLRWMTDGQGYFLARLGQNTDEHLEGPSRLPGWSGRHLLSHLGHNARALGRLAHWASTGETTPMYASPDTRAAEIEAGATWPVRRLRAFVEEEHDRLADALDRLTESLWQTQVVTAQGRHVTADVIPWLRARELWVHACDLPVAGDYADFPADLVDALIADALSRRSAQGVELEVRADDRPANAYGTTPRDGFVEGSAASLARWLTGRGSSARLRRTAPGTTLPVLPPWL